MGAGRHPRFLGAELIRQMVSENPVRLDQLHPMQLRRLSSGRNRGTKRSQENPRRIGREFRAGAFDIDRNGIHGAVIQRRRGCERRSPADICDVCELAPAVLDMIGTNPLSRIILWLSLIHISEPTRLGMISYAVFCLKKKKKT